jgi:alpha/beta superfamily hydrolase
VEMIEGRAVRIESAGPALEALLHLPEGEPPYPGMVICHPHPQFGGEMHNNVVGALVRACLGEGVAALRFNFRGVGSSGGSFGNGVGEQDDARAALHYLRGRPEIDAERILLGGYSFGATVAINVAGKSDGIAALVAVSSPALRGDSVISHLRAPSLLIAGDRDQYVDHNLLLEYREQLGPGVTVQVLEGVDHFWWGSDSRLTEIVGAFLRRHLK